MKPKVTAGPRKRIGCDGIDKTDGFWIDRDSTFVLTNLVPESELHDQKKTEVGSNLP